MDSIKAIWQNGWGQEIEKGVDEVVRNATLRNISFVHGLAAICATGQGNIFILILF
ncbi:MAG: hypothetical protein KAH86_00200 [Methanosarcinales archaeon]|nr:hypothetical protein [Methanosarcinales archaeon]